MGFEDIIKQLAASGTVALLLGFICWRLYLALVELRRTYEGDPKDPERFPGKLRQVQLDAQKREDDLRGHYEGLLQTEREKQAATLDDLLNTLRGLK